MPTDPTDPTDRPVKGDSPGPDARQAEKGDGVRCQSVVAENAQHPAMDAPSGPLSPPTANPIPGEHDTSAPGDIPPPPAAGTDIPAPGPPRRRLTPKERRILNAYLQTSDPAETARGCGVSLDVVRNALKRPHVASALDDALRSMAPSEAELLAMAGQVARLDPALIGTLYVTARKCCGLPAAVDGDGPDAPACRCVHPGETVRRFDWHRARELGVSRLVKHVALDRQGNETAEWRSADSAIALLAKMYGMTSDANVNVQVNQLGSLSVEQLRAIVEG